MTAGQLVIGVLAVQGDFAEHAAMLRRAAANAPADRAREVVVREVRTPRDLLELDGLIVPGGESTTIGKLLVAYGLEAPIRAAAQDGLPVWGTCAGMILLARDIVGGEPDGRIGLMDLTVQRNAFGRQLDSFEVDLAFSGLDRPIHAVFIRAPLVERVGPEAEVLATLPDGRVVAARQGNLLATSFHPELTPDTRLHAWFIESCRQAADARLLEAPADARSVEAPADARLLEAQADASSLGAPADARLLEAPADARLLDAPADARLLDAPADARLHETPADIGTLEAPAA